MREGPGDYIPALRFHSLTRSFDTVLASTLKEEKFKSLLARQANVQPGDRVLDVGCGTGTLAVLLKQAVPEAHVVGVDADRAALDIARKKATEAQVEIELHEALAWDAPFELECDHSVRRVCEDRAEHGQRKGDTERRHDSRTGR